MQRHFIVDFASECQTGHTYIYALSPVSKNYCHVDRVNEWTHKAGLEASDAYWTDKKIPFPVLCQEAAAAAAWQKEWDISRDVNKMLTIKASRIERESVLVCDLFSRPYIALECSPQC